jgi:small subunit ribosomal protein S1
VSNIVDFGAFIDLNGIDGLIHISELSWSHVNHPSEALTIGQEVTVKVLDIDRDRQRISLGLKQTQKDPWQQVFENRQVNEIVHGKVTKLVSFGSFVEIEEGVEGLIHISELAQHHVEDPHEILRQGQEVNVKIIEIDPDRRRLSLSLKRLEPEYRIHEDIPVEEEAEESEEEAELEAAEAEVELAEAVEAEAVELAEEPVEAEAVELAEQAVEAEAVELAEEVVEAAEETVAEEAAAEPVLAEEKAPEPAVSDEGAVEGAIEAVEAAEALEVGEAVEAAEAASDAGASEPAMEAEPEAGDTSEDD